MEMANPLLESFGEPPKACVTNSNQPPANLKKKETQICHQFVPLIKMHYRVRYSLDFDLKSRSGQG